MTAPGCSPVHRTAPDPKAEGFAVPGAPDFLQQVPLADRKADDDLCIAYAEERLAHRELNLRVSLGRDWIDCVSQSASGQEAKACEAKTKAMAKKAEALIASRMRDDLKTASAARKCGKAAS